MDKDGDNSIKLIVWVIITIVMIVGWGVSIGINYQRMNNFESMQIAANLRMDKLEKIVSDGMNLRVKLQSDVDNIKDTLKINGGKLDKVYDLLNDHIVKDKTVKADGFERKIQ